LSGDLSYLRHMLQMSRRADVATCRQRLQAGCVVGGDLRAPEIAEPRKALLDQSTVADTIIYPTPDRQQRRYVQLKDSPEQARQLLVGLCRSAVQPQSSISD